MEGFNSYLRFITPYQVIYIICKIHPLHTDRSMSVPKGYTVYVVITLKLETRFIYISGVQLEVAKGPFDRWKFEFEYCTHILVVTNLVID